MNECDNRPFKLCSILRFDSDRTEWAPDDILWNIDSNKKWDTRTQSISFLQHIIKQNNDEAWSCELDDYQHRIADSDLRNWTICTWPGISEGLAESYYHCQQFLRALVQFGLLRVMQVQRNDASTDEQLQNPASWDNWWESQLHERASIGSEDDSHPVEGVTALGS